MDKLKEIFGTVCMGNSVSSYCLAAGIIIGGILLVWVLDKIVVAVMKKKAKKTNTSVDDFLTRNIEKSLIPILYIGVVYYGVKNIALNPVLAKYINMAAVGLVTIFGIRFLAHLANYFLENIWMMKEQDPAKKKNIKGFMIITKALIWGLGIVILLDNMGYKVSALLAGLGIGGIAVALAAQAVLGDLFAYISIVFDRPFEVGDFIIIDNYLGTIEDIGIKTTKIRSLGGEMLIFSNTDLTNSRVRNYKKMEKRRAVFTIGVTYNTGAEKLKKIPGIVREIIGGVKDTTFDRSHFVNYGDFTLNFESVYYIDGSDYNKYMDIQQEINIKLYEAFEKEGIEFAFPTQTLYLNKQQ